MGLKEILISYQSGHYKKFKGKWNGDSIWIHFVKEDGTTIHVNKNLVEYIQVSDVVVNPHFSKYERGDLEDGAGKD